MFCHSMKALIILLFTTSFINGHQTSFFSIFLPLKLDKRSCSQTRMRHLCDPAFTVYERELVNLCVLVGRIKIKIFHRIIRENPVPSPCTSYWILRVKPVYRCKINVNGCILLWPIFIDKIKKSLPVRPRYYHF